MLNALIYPQKKIRRPSYFWLFTESGRAITELGAYFPYRNLLRHAATGDGHPVMVLPGFMTTDLSTAPMRGFLKQLGYAAYGWEQGRNYATIDLIDVLSDRLQEIYEKHQRKVSLIGWSLGGVYARQMAKAHPELVRQVVTMGAPFAGVLKPNNAVWIYNLISSSKVEEVDPDLIADLPKPAPVPTTAIYSKQDGIVPWRLCMELEEDDWHQNVQVRGSHLGLGINPAVLTIIADRLQYEQKSWQPFKPGLLKKVLLFPSVS